MIHPKFEVSLFLQDKRCLCVAIITMPAIFEALGCTYVILIICFGQS